MTSTFGIEADPIDPPRSRAAFLRVLAPAQALALLGLALLTVPSCAHNATYDPAADRKIPRPPKVITWTYEATIDASVQAIWATMLDFDSYSTWNPFIVQARGRAAVGERVDITVALGDKQRTMWHQIYALESERRFCWRDGGPTTAFVTGSRCRILTPLADGSTRLRQVLTIGGGLRGQAQARYGDALQAALEAETQAIDVEVHRRARPR